MNAATRPDRTNTSMAETPRAGHDPLCAWHPGYPSTPLDFCDCNRIAIVRDDERTALSATLATIHHPREDQRGSLVTWAYCSCGAMETFTAEDGYLAIGPARYPCATIRAIKEHTT